MSFAIGATVITTSDGQDLRRGQQEVRGDRQVNAEEAPQGDPQGQRRRDEDDAAQGRHGRPDAGAMLADFDKAAQDVWKDLVGKVYTQKELDVVLKSRAEYRAKHPKK